MRDPNRIYRILDLLMKVWIDRPDLRLGQILLNLEEKIPYQLEDTEWEKKLQHLADTGEWF